MNVAKKLLVVIYTIFVSIALACFTILFIVRTIISKDFLSASLKKLDFTQIKVKDFNLSDFTSKYGENASLEDAIAAELENAGIDVEAAHKIINDKNLREFIGAKASEAIDAGANKESVTPVTKDEVAEALNVLDLSEENYEEVTDFLNNLITEFNKEVQNGNGL